MKKVKLLLIGIFLLFGCQITSNEGVQVYEKIKNSIVEVGDSQGPSGTGFFHTDKGYIITCYHVINDIEPADIHVRTKDETLHWVKLIGYSEEKDIAVLKLVKTEDVNIVPVKFSTKKEIKVGETVYMYGHPRIYSYILTKGIVSKIRKDFRLRYNSYKAIQTDAEMNYGNSGGILVNTNGRLIGMSSALYTLNGVGMGLNFAIHIDEIKNVIKKVLENEKIGISGESVDFEFGEEESELVPEEKETEKKCSKLSNKNTLLKKRILELTEKEKEVIVDNKIKTTVKFKTEF